MAIDYDKSAVVLIEYQNQWTKPGLYHGLISREIRRQGVIGNTVRLLRTDRSKGRVVSAPLAIAAG